MSTTEATRAARETSDPQELRALYEAQKDRPNVVKAIVNNQSCPDEIKKRALVDALEKRIPTYLNTAPGGADILAIMRKGLEAWQPVQRLAPTPDIDPNDADAQHLLSMADKKRAVILYGPPGTSKTFLARIIAKALADGDERRVRYTQFHASYSYEDFVEGIVPRVVDKQVTYDVEPKVFKQFCKDARDQPSQRFVFIIDEINRADVGKVFGEVFSGLEYRGEPVRLLYSRDPFVIPSNVIIIGTMNDIDRSTTDLDFALRRRFYFFEIRPNRQRLEQVLTADSTEPIDADFLQDVGTAFDLTQPIYPLGHAYFKGVTGPADLHDLWEHQLRPLLEQYFEFERGKVDQIKNLYSPIWVAAEAETAAGDATS